MKSESQIVMGARDREARARALVLSHGWNSTSYQLINPGIELWFDSSAGAVVGFVEWGRFVVVAGAPVSLPAQLPNVMSEFECWARSRNRRVCYFGAGQRLERVTAGSREYSSISLGAQPSWNPVRWPAIIAKKESLRAQLNRARNKQVTVSEWDSLAATNSPRLKRCLEDWLSTRGLPPLHFLVEPETLSRLEDRKVLVAERAEQVVGFLILSPIPARNGWLVEQIIRGRRAPNGTAELLLDFAMRVAAEGGANYLTLGLAPLSEHSQFDWSSVPAWLRYLLSWVRAHGNRFYNFQGLDKFKAKFEPDEWEDITAIVNSPTFPLAALYSIAGAFGGRSPISLVAVAIANAVKRELLAIWKFVPALFRARSATPR